jgi:hypothetical protein
MINNWNRRRRNGSEEDEGSSNELEGIECFAENRNHEKCQH